MYGLTYYTRCKNYKNPVQNAVLRAARCIASNLVDTALIVLKKHNINIRANIDDEYGVYIRHPKDPYCFKSFLYIAFMYSNFKTIRRILYEFGEWNFSHTLDDLPKYEYDEDHSEKLKNILSWTTSSILFNIPHLKCLSSVTSGKDIARFCELEVSYLMQKTHRSRSYIYSYATQLSSNHDFYEKEKYLTYRIPHM